MRVIQLENGYIRLDNKKAEELFELLVEQGVFWEHISQMFNEAALDDKNEEDGIAKLQEDMAMMKLNFGTMLKTMQSMNSKLTALPSPQYTHKDIVQEDSQSNKVIKDVEIKEVKPKVGGKNFLKDTLDKFNSMGRK